MGIRFKIHATPRPEDRKKESLIHARALSEGTDKMEDICEIICQRSSISSADVKAVLDSFVWMIGFSLKYGRHIELEDLGHFSPSLRTVQQKNGKFTVEVDGVNFRCSEKLKATLKGTELEKVKKESGYSRQTRQQRMFDYLERNKHISARAYAELNDCSRYRAAADLKQYMADGLISRVGGGTHVMYLKNEEK